MVMIISLIVIIVSLIVINVSLIVIIVSLIVIIVSILIVIVVIILIVIKKLFSGVWISLRVSCLSASTFGFHGGRFGQEGDP